MINFLNEQYPLPYYAVIFSSTRNDDSTYDAVAEKLFAIAQEQSGFLGVETARECIGITVSYWTSIEAIHLWKHHIAHEQTKKQAARWYKSYRLRICKVEVDHGVNFSE